MTGEYPGGYCRMLNKINKYTVLSFQNTMRPTRQWIKDELPDGAKILDYGCGNGSLGATGLLSHNGKQLIVNGLDDFDRENPAAVYHNTDNVPRHDYVIASHVLEHYQPADVRRLLKWYNDHSTKGLYIVLPNNSNPFFNFWRDSTHVRPYDEMPELYMWIEEAGYHIEKVVRSGLPNIRWYSRYARLLFGKLLCFSPFEDNVIVCKN